MVGGGFGGDDIIPCKRDIGVKIIKVYFLGDCFFSPQIWSFGFIKFDISQAKLKFIY